MSWTGTSVRYGVNSWSGEELIGKSIGWVYAQKKEPWEMPMGVKPHLGNRPLPNTYCIRRGDRIDFHVIVNANPEVLDAPLPTEDEWVKLRREAVDIAGEIGDDL